MEASLRPPARPSTPAERAADIILIQKKSPSPRDATPRFFTQPTTAAEPSAPSPSIPAPATSPTSQDLPFSPMDLLEATILWRSAPTTNFSSPLKTPQLSFTSI